MNTRVNTPPKRTVNLTKGDPVYYEMSGKTYGPYTVQNVTKTAVMEMVSFKETTVAVGICYIKKHPDDKLGKISDYIPQNEYLVKNVYEEGMNLDNRGWTQMEGTRNAAGNLDLLFFRPNYEMLQWLVKYAAGRLIIDVGCGSGRLTTNLVDLGAKACGIDPFFDMDNVMAINQDRILNQKGMIHFLPRRIEEVPQLFQGQGNKVLLLFARPCHSAFVSDALKLKDKETEALYITVEKNLTMYNDLGAWDNKKKKIHPQGRSADNEVFFSVK